MKKSLLLGFICCISMTSFVANADMKRLYEKGMFNLNQATTLGGDRNGWSGGGFGYRAELVNPNIISATMPTWNAGCGGIDFYGGSFSMINSDELNQAMRGIMQGASSYAFSLALGSVCPSCKTLAMELQKKMRQINDMARNTCQASMDALGRYIEDPADSSADAKSGKVNSYITSWATELGTSDDWSWNAFHKDPDGDEKNAQKVGKTFLGDITWKFLTDAKVDTWDFVISDEMTLKQAMYSMLGTTQRWEGTENDEAGNKEIKEQDLKGPLTLKEFFVEDTEAVGLKVTVWECLNPTADKKVACIGDNLKSVQVEWKGIVSIMIEKYAKVLGEIKTGAIEHDDPDLALVLEDLSIAGSLQVLMTDTNFSIQPIAEYSGIAASLEMINKVLLNLRHSGAIITNSPGVAEDTKTQRAKFNKLVEAFEKDLQGFEAVLRAELDIRIQTLSLTARLRGMKKN